MKAALLHRVALTPPAAPPPPITVDEARAMSASQRREVAADVGRFLHGRYFDSQRDREMRSQLTSLAQTNTASLVGTKDVAIVTGDNVLGKSTLLYQVAFAAHRQHVAPHLDPATLPAITVSAGSGAEVEDLTVHHAPVLFLSLKAGTTEAKFNSQIFQALGYDRSAERRAYYLDLLERHGLRLLIVDDLHLLTTTEKRGREALDHLKAVVTAVGELGATVIFAGANLHTHPVMDDPQVTGRAYEIPVAPYSATTGQDRLAFQLFLRECSSPIQPYLPLGDPDQIHNALPQLLLSRSAGYHRDLLTLLREATIAAIEDGTWAITEKHVTNATPSTRAQQRAAATARTARPVTPIVASDSPAAGGATR